MRLGRGSASSRGRITKLHENHGVSLVHFEPWAPVPPSTLRPMSDRIPPAALSVLVALAALLPSAAAAGFHEGGVASCGGCHVVHRSEDGSPVPVQGELLRAGSATDTCLLCHGEGAGSVLGTSVLLPGPEVGAGDFVFLLEDELNDGPTGPARSIPGHAAGHNVVAPGSGLTADSRWITAPGGGFPSASLGCTSCHDPHGNQNFRMLHDAGPVQGGAFVFSDDAPEAEGLDARRGVAESPGEHTAYRAGWTAWCGNCHGSNYHEGIAGEGFEHPVDEPLGRDMALYYDAYDGDANPDGGNAARSYIPEVPFEDGDADRFSTSGPRASSRLSCMTCHRAHATSAPAAGRWDFRVHTLSEDGAVSGSYPIPSPYPDPAQRQLCVKCHDTQGHDRGKGCLQCHREGGPRGDGVPSGGSTFGGR